MGWGCWGLLSPEITVSREAVSTAAISYPTATTRAADRNCFASQTVNDGIKNERHLDRI